ncbi:MAG: hypothetical protein WAM44_10465, partial [Chthoniobacterales bacterium]
MSANVEYRKDGLSAIWRDLTAEPVWKYEELPPLLLPDLTGLDLFELGDTELARAHWFWSRRPKLTFFERAAVMIVALCVLIGLSIALVHWHHTSVLKRAVEMIIVLWRLRSTQSDIASRFFVGDASTSEASIDSSAPIM